MARKLRGMFRHVDLDDLEQMVWEGFIEAARTHDPSLGSFEAFAWRRGYGKALDGALRDVRQSPRALAAQALLTVADTKAPALDHAGLDPFSDEDPALTFLKETASEGAFRIFFGGTFEAFRAQGEQGLVNHLTRLTAFRELKRAFSTLGEDEWKLFELYYIDVRTWAEVGEALGVSERQAKRRDEEIRRKLKRELVSRGVDRAPPSEGR
ncbi:MAG: sigma-70 family RNA polymerase sigma factor [Byssovorax sp.]